MRVFIISLILFFTAPLNAWAGCATDITDISPDYDDQEIRQAINNAYFIGLVRGAYSQEYPNGRFKEAGIQPFMVYRAAPDLDLNEMIVIKGDENKNPDGLSDMNYECEIEIPKKGDLAELIIFEIDGQPRILTGFPFIAEQYLKEHRQNLKFVNPRKTEK